MVATDVTIEATPGNMNLLFQPLGESVRGRFDANQLPGETGSLRMRFPTPIPGQRIGLNAKESKGFVIEPLHDPEHAAVREECAKVGSIAPAVREIANIDVATWAYWIGEIVAQGLAKVVSGKVPKVEGKARLRFHGVDTLDPIDKLTVAIEKQTEAFTKLATVIAKGGGWDE
jgi:hypothetical protein